MQTATVRLYLDEKKENSFTKYYIRDFKPNTLLTSTLTHHGVKSWEMNSYRNSSGAFVSLFKYLKKHQEFRGKFIWRKLCVSFFSAALVRNMFGSYK
jgi:hypothetical protein